MSRSSYTHVSLRDLNISRIGLPILLQEICGPILGIYKSLTDTWMWKLGLRHRNSQQRNTYMEFSLQCGQSLVWDAGDWYLFTIWTCRFCVKNNFRSACYAYASTFTIDHARQCSSQSKLRHRNGGDVTRRNDITGNMHLVEKDVHEWLLQFHRCE